MNKKPYYYAKAFVIESAKVVASTPKGVESLGAAAGRKVAAVRKERALVKQAKQFRAEHDGAQGK